MADFGGYYVNNIASADFDRPFSSLEITVIVEV